MANPSRKVAVMNASNLSREQQSGYELRFSSLFDPGRGYSFPCDAAGVVDLDALSERARLSYFFARTVIGREVAHPMVQAHKLH